MNKREAKQLSEFQPKPACSCQICVGYCKRPGWPTPSEAQRIINAGYGDRLMLDYFYNHDTDDFVLLAPATQGYAGRWAPADTANLEGGCIFLTNDNKCELHDIKPIECACAYHVYTKEENINNFHQMVASLWNTKKSKRLLHRWSVKYLLKGSLDDGPPQSCDHLFSFFGD